MEDRVCLRRAGAAGLRLVDQGPGWPEDAYATAAEDQGEGAEGGRGGEVGERREGRRDERPHGFRRWLRRVFGSGDDRGDRRDERRKDRLPEPPPGE